MAKINQLPQEILEIVFQNLNKSEALKCRLVCFRWYSLGTQYSFDELLIADDHHLESFLNLLLETTTYRLGSMGKFVKTIVIGIDRLCEKTHFSFSLFEQLVKCCPYVERFDAEEDELSSYMLQISDEIKWKHLKELPPDCNSFEHNMKYSKCLVKLTTGLDHQNDFNFLSSFRSLEYLCLPPSLPLTTMEELGIVLSSCPKLTSLNASLNIKEKKKESLCIYPYLKQLTIQNYSMRLPEGFIDCISDRLICLSELHLIMHRLSVNHSLQDEAYDRLVHYALMQTRKKFSLRLTIKNGGDDVMRKYNQDGNHLNQLIYHYLRCMLIPQFAESQCYEIYNVLTIRRGFKGYLDFSTTWQRLDTNLLVCKLYLIWPSGNSLFTHLEHVASNIHELILNGGILSDSLLQHDLGIFMAQYQGLQKVTLTDYVLQSFQVPTLKSVEKILVSHSYVRPKFFQDLANCCTNLKSLSLKDNTYVANVGDVPSSSIQYYFVEANLYNLSLERLEIVMPQSKSLLFVETKAGSTCYRLEPKRKPRRLSCKERIEVCKTSKDSRLIINCCQLQILTLNGTEFHVF
ncbi:hypothetical protein G6F37_010134 [Rhizopus arrhizus]|nr:hypothetical protein G6F38_010216 [Rhizopus arrhizus]KAG1153682.1 hypothetical protein G6F37_010134 [Rhizopus arrhizus]